MTVNIPLPAGVLKSWKTSLVGAASAVIAVIQASSYHGDWLAAVKDHSVQMAMAIAILGFVSKDWNTTGGSIGQPSTPQALALANQQPSVINPPAPEPKAK